MSEGEKGQWVLRNLMSLILLEAVPYGADIVDVGADRGTRWFSF